MSIINECFKWCLVRYLNPADHHSDVKFPIKVRDIHKIERKNYNGITVFGYENKTKYPAYV